MVAMAASAKQVQGCSHSLVPFVLSSSSLFGCGGDFDLAGVRVHFHATDRHVHRTHGTDATFDFGLLEPERFVVAAKLRSLLRLRHGNLSVPPDGHWPYPHQQQYRLTLNAAAANTFAR